MTEPIARLLTCEIFVPAFPRFGAQWHFGANVFAYSGVPVEEFHLASAGDRCLPGPDLTIGKFVKLLWVGHSVSEIIRREGYPRHLLPKLSILDFHRLFTRDAYAVAG